MIKPAKKTTKMQLTRKELFLELDRQLSEAYHALVDTTDRLTCEIKDVLTHIFGENFVLDVWWDWYKGGPAIFIKLTGSVQNTLGGLDLDLEEALDKGYMPLSVAISDRLDYIGMSWYHVRVFGYEYYMSNKEMDRFVQEFDRLIHNKVKEKEEGEHV